jgi:hypothetical protein
LSIVKRASLIGIVALLIAVGLYVTVFVARLPESNCKRTTVSELWAPDRAYKATLLKKSCNSGESLSYSIRIDAYAPPLPRAWFVPGVELEDDSYPTGDPAFQWAGPRRLEVVVSTRVLTGSLTTHVGDDLTVIRTYKPREPQAFPNY